MHDKRLRRQIAFEAAQLLRQGQESEYPRAKRRAARKLGLRFRPANLPSNNEVRTQLQQINELADARHLFPNLRRLRLESLRLMRLLRRFRPRLVGAVWTGADRSGDRIRLLVHCDHVDTVAGTLTKAALAYHAPIAVPIDSNRHRSATLLRIEGAFPARITIVPRDAETGPDELDESAGIDELERCLADEFDGVDLDAELDGIDPGVDRFEVYRLVLEQLEEVSQDPHRHPEGDALFHALQVFDLAVRERPFDEEFLTAALLHDAGKAVEPDDAVSEGLELLEGTITRRTARLIAGLPDARLYLERDLPSECRLALEESDDFEDLLLLAEIDLAGRRSGARTRRLDEALDLLQNLHEGADWDASDD